jgi:hypothetical protein
MVCVGMQDEERKGHQFVIFDCRVTPEEFIVLFEDTSDKTPPPADAADGRIAVQALSSPERPDRVVWSWNGPGGSYPVGSGPTQENASVDTLFPKNVKLDEVD